MQLFPQSFPFTQFGGFRPPLAIEAVDGAVRVSGAGDCIGAAGAAVAAVGFILPENMEGFFAGAADREAPFSSDKAFPFESLSAALLHDIRLWVVGSWQ